MLAHPGLVDVKITAKAATRDAARALIGELEPRVRERLGDCVYAEDAGTLEAVSGALLSRRDWTLAVGESCTGGLLAAAITRVPGASTYFRGGVVAYSNEAKCRLLDVAPDLIERYGAVSEEVAGAMALGAQTVLRADVGVSVTGVAGPDGGTPEKPVGLVYIGLTLPDGSMQIKRLDWPGSREAIQRRAVIAALATLWRALRYE
jgi:nicotinamide-nucleotide amidase